MFSKDFQIVRTTFLTLIPDEFFIFELELITLGAKSWTLQNQKVADEK